MAKKTFLSIFEKIKDNQRQLVTGCCLPTDIRKIATSYTRMLMEICARMEYRNKLNDKEQSFIKCLSSACLEWMVSDSDLVGSLPLVTYIENFGSTDNLQPFDVDEYMAITENLCHSCDKALSVLNTAEERAVTTNLTIGKFINMTADALTSAMSEFVLPHDASKMIDYMSTYILEAIEQVSEANQFSDTERQAMQTFAEAVLATQHINLILAKYIESHCNTDASIFDIYENLCEGDWIWNLGNLCGKIDECMHLYNLQYAHMLT